MLSNKDLATLTNRLQTPVIIGDIMHGHDVLGDDVHMALHEILSDDQPDSALLAIALSAKTIAKTCAAEAASLKMLTVACDRIIIEYGPIWLRNALDKNLDENLVFETLAHIPEDLETLAELLDYNAIVLKNQDAVALCDILSTQARAQALIAQTFLDAFETQDDAPWDMEQGFDPMITPMIANDAMTAVNNVIPFPGLRA